MCSVCFRPVREKYPYFSKKIKCVPYVSELCGKNTHIFQIKSNVFRMFQTCAGKIPIFFQKNQMCSVCFRPVREKYPCFSNKIKCVPYVSDLCGKNTHIFPKKSNVFRMFQTCAGKIPMFFK